MKTQPLEVKSRLWIINDQGTFLGQGRIALLLAIDQKGSISKAARSMNMSYLKAWKLVRSMNTVSGTPLVTKISGGKGGGGSKLTKEGRNAIDLYQKLNSRCKNLLEHEVGTTFN